MARIWMEGFEDGIPHGDYLESYQYPQFIDTLAFVNYYPSLGTGRGTLSKNCIQFLLASAQNCYIQKTLSTSLSELYFRVYFKIHTAFGACNEIIALKDTAGNNIFSLYNTSGSAANFDIKARIGGSYATATSIVLSNDVWYKAEMYIKINSSTGAYELKIDNTSIISASGVNTGSNNIQAILLGHSGSASNSALNFDDIALNDTTGSVNNSWCGEGTIVSLKPKGVGNKSQFTTSQGFVLAEDGTSTTNIEITGHGLSNGDVIYNVTRGAYRIVTVVDANNLTVSSVTGQTQNDVIVGFSYVSTITAISGTNGSVINIPGHTLITYDVIVNTSRSDAIRRVITANGNSLTIQNYFTPYQGSNVNGQTTGDNIKTFKVKQYPITEHYKALSQSMPNPSYANISSETPGQIDTFNMQELVSDKLVPTGASVVAVSHNIYAKEAGAGTQIKPVFRIGSTDYEGGAISLKSGTLQYQTIYEKSPATNSAFTASEIDSLEAGVEVV